MVTLNITQPDDWHIHLRDGDVLKTTVHDAARQFNRAIVMPNLKRPVTTVSEANSYRKRILAHVPEHLSFHPLMTLYLTDETSAKTIAQAKASGIISGCKLYPSGATTHSEAGVTRIDKIYPALEAMMEYQIPLLIHGEVVDSEIDVFDREAVFIERHLGPLTERFPHLKIVFEHITTKEAVDFVKSGSTYLAATLTPHHLHINRNALFAGGLRPHHYCLPVLKRKEDQHALIQAAISGHPKFFLGTDSAPHSKTLKESSCGCAGIYNAFSAIEHYAHIFDEHNALNRLEAFASHFGPDFYQVPRNTGSITLIKSPWTLPEHLNFGPDKVIPFRSGQTINWQLAPNET